MQRLLTIFSIFLFTASLAHAAPVSGNYLIGANFGVPTYSEVSDTDIGYKVYGGLQLYNALALELSYNDLGSASDKGRQIELSGLNLSAVGSINVNPQVTLALRIGSFVWNADRSNFPGQSRAGNSLSGGGGIYFNVANNYYLRGDLEYFTADEENVLIYSLGAMALF